VTVTGVSPDAQSHGDAWRWVSYNDPTLGEVTAPASEFMWLWGLQGYSGVTVAAEPPPSAPDPMPWVAFSAAIMALISISPLGRLRKGIGGKLEAGTSIGGSSKVTYSVPKPAPKPVANPKPAAPVGVEKAEALFEANPPPPPTPPIPPGVTKAEEEFEAHAPPEAPPPLDLAKLLQQDYAAGEAWESEMAYEAFRLAETSDSSSDTGLPATGDLALAARLGRLGYSGYRAYQASAVSFSALGSGYYGVAVDPTRIPVGERIPFRTDLGYAGTRYSASGLANATADHILEAANGKVAVGLAVGVPVAINLYDYGVGGHSDVGIQSPEFAASTLVDVGKSAAVGLAAAGIVAGVVLGVAALGVTAPAWGAIVAVAGVGLLLSAAIEAVKTADGKDADDALKQQVTEGIEAWGDIAEVVGDLVD
jgi:hypothetical protein